MAGPASKGVTDMVNRRHMEVMPSHHRVAPLAQIESTT
jgi:hypothetical protein